ncbi:MAG: SufD family Fe-S cluster assembly protein [Oscillospiraceae bacterium]|nr:SufD family Fe-S cluster assembly protein [Oscillospiraceae bacterium]
MDVNFNSITGDLLKVISDYDGVEFKGAYNIRQDSECAGRKSSENVSIESKTDAPGIVITVKPGTKGETVFIPACVTHSNVDDLVYNDFYIGEGADVVIVAGCGVHSDGEETARHNGIHRFFLAKDSKVLYKEKHVGTGTGKGLKKIDPVTDCYLEEGSRLEMDTIQLGGVDRSTRNTSAVLAKDAKLIVRERIMTDNAEVAVTNFKVKLDGEDSGADLVSRSVAKGNSHQEFYSVVEGNNRCTGHSACDAILAENGTVDAQPALNASHVDAALIHEAAIGKIAGEQLMKLRTLGLTEEEAEAKIIEGFLK